MGYYNTNKHIKRKHAASIKVLRWTSVAAVSALAGAGLAIVAYPNVQGRHSLETSTMYSTAEKVQLGKVPFGKVPLGKVPSGEVPTSADMSVHSGIIRAVKKVEPAVVGIVNYKRVSDFFTQQSKLQANDVGSGVLISKDKKHGFFVTNNHVVQGAAKVEVVLKKGKHVTATVVGTDPYTDLAVIKVPEKDVKGVSPVVFANSDKLQVGEPAIAIGSPMGLDFEDSVTSGIVSARGRVMPVEQPNDPQHNVLDYQTVIQTDAAINPGNSGGPLLNINGEIIGINSSKIVDPTVEGMGFAIPSNEVQNIAGQIMRTGHAAHPSIGIEGISLTTIPEEWWPDVPVDYGVWVRSVLSSETKAGGLKAQDVIVGYNGKTVKTMADLRTYLFQSKPGQTIELKVYRGTKPFILKVKLGRMESPNTTHHSAQSTAPDSFSSIPSLFGE
ncbi:S1C family serine protease [Alicyclobacillus sp. SO9]|uniref:S1C family serine protease n=1 Tax=Alicyclobacillus sp. SO9 TaxID=2665646 RepID=UPI0018E76F1E|nr:trypsin-like peptidase domain-containing protein [Alicyclobacillus sp. SO9]QQE78927.1 trypsin-like peptidase domain-containing protein [Alicyclobacillus sp. SO9]